MNAETNKAKFKSLAKAKGWMLKDLAARWGITARAMSYITANPSQRDLDAAEGLPTRKEI